MMDRVRLDRQGALAHAKAEAALVPVKRAQDEVQRLERRIDDIAAHR